MFTFYRKLLLLCLVTAVFNSMQAQKRTILKKNDTIKLEFDEYGKLKSAPDGFVLKTGRSYSFDISSEAVKERQEELFEFVKKNLSATLTKLQNPDDTFSLICRAYLMKANIDSLVDQMTELYEILASEDPVKEFNESETEFTYFLGSAFLKEHLFFDSNSILPKIYFDNKLANGEEVKPKKDAEGKKGNTINIYKIDSPDDSLEVRLTTFDMKKYFLWEYFTASRKKFQEVFKEIPVVSFYASDIRTDTALKNEILKFQETLSGKIKEQSRQLNEQVYFCNSGLYNEYATILSHIGNFEKNNRLVRILESNWLASWLWFDEGALALSPLGYTSPELMDKINISDTARSKVFDRYIDSLINRMIVSPDLTEPRARVSLMDSLIRLRGTGKTRFSKTALIQQMEKDNKKKMKSAEEVNTIAQSLIFKSVKPGRLDGAFVGAFDASDPAKIMEAKRSFTVPNDYKQAVLIYNLKPEQDVSISKNAESIPDQSKMIKDLNEVGDMFSVLTGGAANALTGFGTLFSHQKNLVSGIPVLKIEPQRMDLTSKNDSSTSVWNVMGFNTIQFTFNNGSFNAVFSGDFESKPKTINLDDLYEKYWESSVFKNCELVRVNVKEKIDSFFQQYKVANKGIKFSVSDLDSAIESINKRMSEIANEVSDKLSLNVAYNNLANWYNYLESLNSVFGPIEKHQLPPSGMKLLTNKTPSYRSRYESLDKESGAKLVKYEVTLTDADAKSSIKLKNTYKTAPTHWITGSLGVGYINNTYRRSEVTVTNGVITNSPDDDNVRLLMGINFHIWPVILADDRSIFNMKEWRQVRTRLSLFAGASFPKPWYNLHAGLSVDVWAGLKLTGGVHFYRHTYYQVLNNQVTDEKSRYESNGAFFGVTMDPGTFVKLIGIFK